jgi:peptidoglycan/xylan/chitin deacetylase (PgdA/CDA1 family)
LGQVPIDEAENELRACKSALERQLGITRPLFCFPGGSMSDATRAAVSQIGFANSFIPNPSIRYNNHNTVSPFSMSRVGMPEAPAYHLEAELDGPFHTARKLLRGE